MKPTLLFHLLFAVTSAPMHARAPISLLDTDQTGAPAENAATISPAPELRRVAGSDVLRLVVVTRSGNRPGHVAFEARLEGTGISATQVVTVDRVRYEIEESQRRPVHAMDPSFAPGFPIFDEISVSADRTLFLHARFDARWYWRDRPGGAGILDRLRGRDGAVRSGSGTLTVPLELPPKHAVHD